MNPFHTDWDEQLDVAEFAINDAWQESVQETPFMHAPVVGIGCLHSTNSTIAMLNDNQHLLHPQCCGRSQLGSVDGSACHNCSLPHNFPVWPAPC